MNFYTLLHDPTWSKVHTGTLIAIVGPVGIAALRLLHVRELHKHNAVKQAASTYAGFPEHLLVRRPRSLRNTILVTLFVGISVLSFLFALRNYIILSNWDEGHARDLIGDHVGAVICYKKALRMDYTLRHTHLLIGESLEASDRVGGAIQEFKAASKDEHSDPEPYDLLGKAYDIENMPVEAAEAYKRAAAIAPGDPRYYISIGACMEELHHPDIAFSAYLYAIHLRPSYLPAQLKLGSLLVNTAHLDEGMAHLKKAISLAPNDVLAHSTLALAYARYKMYDSAVAEFRKAITIDSKFAFAWFNLGVALEHMNEWERALEAFKVCTKLTPPDRAEQAAVALARIEVRNISARLKHKMG